MGNNKFNDKDFIFLKEKIFLNKRQRYIDNVKKYFDLINYKYDVDEFKNKLLTNKLNIKVKNIVEAIKKINLINLFEYLDLNGNKTNIKKLQYPLNIRYIITLSEFEDSINNKFNNKEFNYDKVLIHHNNNEIEIFAEIQSYYSICYSKEDEEYYIAIYLNEKDNANYKKLNFIELYSIIANTSIKEGVIELLELLNIKIIEIQEYVDIYIYNIKLLNKELYKYKYLSNRIKSKLFILEELNKIAIIEIFFNIDKENIDSFLCSNRYLAKKVNKAHNTLIPYINCFELMGFYEKQAIVTSNNFNSTTIYKLNNITEELLRKANNIAKAMIDNNISISKMSVVNIKKYFEIDIKNLREEKKSA